MLAILSPMNEAFCKVLGDPRMVAQWRELRAVFERRIEKKVVQAIGFYSDSILIRK